SEAECGNFQTRLAKHAILHVHTPSFMVVRHQLAMQPAITLMLYHPPRLLRSTPLDKRVPIQASVREVCRSLSTLRAVQPRPEVPCDQTDHLLDRTRAVNSIERQIVCVSLRAHVLG